MNATTQSPHRLAGPPRPASVRRAYRYAIYVVLAALVVVLLLPLSAKLPAFVGYHTYTVGGSSMEPALKQGSVAIAVSTNLSALEVSDIIAFRTSPDSPPVLHRIVEITNNNGELRFITQGDKNAAPDAQPVVLQGRGDKVIYMVPYAGYILDFTGSTLGRVLLIGLPAPLLLVLLLTPGTPAERSKRARRSLGPHAAGQRLRSLAIADHTRRPERHVQPSSNLLAPAGQTQANGPRSSLEAQAAELAKRQPRVSLVAQAAARGLLRDNGD